MLKRTSVIDNWFIKQTKMFNKLDKCASKYGLSFLQFDILLHISEDEYSSPTEIAQTLELSKTSVSRVLKALQRKNLIIKQHDAFDDNRRIDVKITSAGQLIVEELSTEIVEQFDKLDI